ncbi:efflux RND transporter permease subunit [Microbulbifer variabilis]|uniref:efflux RND transporter permease subunit n=1 Tax=Microbulbifer variabilis TaxID=266805 RepID=UPI001CFF2CFE|nr:efflux RND transporter permease subunit [Microbulbifer variabilis]
MKLLEKYSAVIISCGFLLVILGITAGLKLPNALLPVIDRPQIALATSWPGKTASEIEQALVAPLEQELSSIGHLKEIQTNTSNGFAWTTMTFHLDADMEQVYIDVLSRINQVPNWPSHVRLPRVFNFSNGAGATLASFFLYSKTSASEAELIQAFRDHIQPAFSKVPGVASVIVAGTPMEQRVDIEFEPVKLANHSLTIDEVQSRLNDLVDRSGGSLKIGSKEYGLHFNGHVPLNELRNIPIASRGPHIIQLGDIATVHTRLVSDWNYFALQGNRAFYFYLQPAENINVLDSIDSIKQVIDELNRGDLSNLGMEVAFSRDDSKSIRSSLMLVYGSLIVGALLACLVLYWFLRDLRTLFLIFLSIPVCVALVTLGMYIAGKSMNVISLAGVALSIGLLVDAAIIVVENIQRLRQQGLGLLPCIRRGTQEVSGALVSSTISSVIVFLPILAMQSPTGQLFMDLAFTISSALLASLLFALVLLPAIARYTLKGLSEKVSREKGNESNRILSKFINWSVLPATRRQWAYAVLLLCVPVALIVAYVAAPPIDVLPEPKQAMVSTYINFEEPMALDVIEEEVAQIIQNRIERNIGTRSSQISTYGIMCYPAMCNLYFYTHGDWEFDEFKNWVETEVVHDLVGTRIFTRQGQLLQFAMPNSRVSQLDVKGAELPILQSVGRELLAHLRSEFPNAQIQEGTALNDRGVRIEFQPNQEQLIQFGVSLSDFNRYLVTLTDGVYLGNFYTGTNTLPFYLKSRDPRDLKQLLDTEIMIGGHGLVPLRQLTEAKITLAPDNILRVDQDVSVSLNLTPPAEIAMKDFIDSVSGSVKRFMSTGEYQGVHVQFRGSANELKVFLQEFLYLFIAALVILGMIMSFTLGSIKLAAAVLLAIPLSFAGGMLSLSFLNLFVTQNLDVITMIGFVMLMGLVVNNSILLVNQYQAAMNEGANQFEAIKNAVNLRIRPIMLTTITCILGNLPLVLNPGDSAAIYRGLAAVITGGMLFSALLVLVYMSAMLSLPLFKLQRSVMNSEEESRTLSVDALV